MFVSDVAAIVERNGGRVTNAAGGGCRLLLVDDEPQILAINCSLLASAGYTVYSFDRPQKVLEAFPGMQDDVDAVLLDFSMPGMNGDVLLRELKARRPDLPALLISGYADHASVDRMFQEGLGAYLAKPYLPEQLYEKVRVILGEGSG